jgi:2-phosphoglycerate kinase
VITNAAVKVVSELDLENMVQTDHSRRKLKSFIHKYLATTTRLNLPGYLAHQSARRITPGRLPR